VCGTQYRAQRYERKNQMEIKNTKHIKANKEGYVLRHQSKGITRSYLDHLYIWAVKNDLYLYILVKPNETRMAPGYEDRWIMEWRKYCPAVQDQIGENDQCRGMYYCTFGYMPDQELMEQDPRYKG